MQKIKIIFFILLLSFILSSNSNLFSVNETQNRDVDQIQKQQDYPKQEEGFWQSNNVIRIVCATCGAALALIFCIRVMRNSSINIEYRVDEADNKIIIDSGQRYSVEEWKKKYKGTEKYKILFGEK